MRAHTSLLSLALSLLPVCAAAADVYVVRPKSATLSQTASTLAANVAADSFCDELRCVVTVMTPTQNQNNEVVQTQKSQLVVFRRPAA